MTRFAVMIPYFGSYDPDHRACVAELKCPIITCRNNPYIDMARAWLVEETLEKTDAEVLVFIDHDIIFQHHQVELLAEHCITGEYAVLGGAYAARRPRGILTCSPAADVESIEFYKPGLYPAEHVPMGFTAIRREVFDAMSDMPKLNTFMGRQVRPMFAHDTSGTSYYGEDVSFCHRVQQLGFYVGIDAEPRLFHRGTYDYAVEDAAMAIPNHETLTVKFNRG